MNTLHLKALAMHLDCSPEDVIEASYDHYGLTIYDINGGEYAIGTDDEATKACEKYCEDYAWAFKAEFIVSKCGLPDEMTDAIKALQEKKCEDANDAIVSLVEKCGNGFTGPYSFTEEAIYADGRGHFLSSYDGEEIEIRVQDEEDDETLYIYRLN